MLYIRMPVSKNISERGNLGLSCSLIVSVVALKSSNAFCVQKTVCVGCVGERRRPDLHAERGGQGCFGGGVLGWQLQTCCLQNYKFLVCFEQTNDTIGTTIDNSKC